MTRLTRVPAIFCPIAVLVIALLTPVMIFAQTEPVPDTQFGETIEVRRILTEVRVIDRNGLPVLGLGPEDFKVKVGGKGVEVESVLWIPSGVEPVTVIDPQPVIPEDGAPSVMPPEGRLIVVLFQYDYAPRPSRIEGLTRMVPRASEFVGSLGPNDKVAVLVFGSHLELRVDFTADHQSVADTMTLRDVLGGSFDPSRPSEPSLARYLDAEDAKKAADMATALELIGQALQKVPGTKSLVLFGYALGQMSAGNRITNDDGYRRAMEALTTGRTSVFSLDITDADYHSLERGLRTVADDTGGFYYKTHIFPDLAIRKLARVISSYYELSIIPPPGLGKEYLIKVKVDRPKIDVYVRQDHPSSHMW